MTMRTSRKTVTFARPFVLGGADEEFPAGIYTIETDEELLEAISFPVYRRISTLLHLRAKTGLTQKMTVDPDQLEAALQRDRIQDSRPVVTV